MIGDQRGEHMTVSGWGRSTPVRAAVVRPESITQLREMPLESADIIPRGLGSSYGDAAQRSNGTVVDTTRCAASSWVDRSGGVIRVQAGATIGDLIDRYSPRGWFVPVSPGTRHVTVGGAVAADIHGKNHHRDGSFGGHVRSMRLRLADDTIVDISPTVEADLFWATIGGMGLTGMVLDIDLAMMPVETTTVRVETQRFTDLETLMQHMRASDTQHAFSVAWVDLLSGRNSVLTQGSFATAAELEPDPAGPLQQPPSRSIALPAITYPRLTQTPLMRLFNRVYHRAAPAELAVSYESITRFWHPLDVLGRWNRLYGRQGFLQWQCVIPDEHESAFVEICSQLRHAPSYLTVLKRFGSAGPGHLSFPKSGWTLAVDLPATQLVHELLDRLDEIMNRADGRLYLAKDARMSRSTFEAGYPRADDWRAIRATVDPTGRWASDLSVRLGL